MTTRRGALQVTSHVVRLVKETDNQEPTQRSQFRGFFDINFI